VGRALRCAGAVREAGRALHRAPALQGRPRAGRWPRQRGRAGDGAQGLTVGGALRLGGLLLLLLGCLGGLGGLRRGAIGRDVQLLHLLLHLLLRGQGREARLVGWRAAASRGRRRARTRKHYWEPRLRAAAASIERRNPVVGLTMAARLRQRRVRGVRGVAERHRRAARSLARHSGAGAVAGRAGLWAAAAAAAGAARTAPCAANMRSAVGLGGAPRLFRSRAFSAGARGGAPPARRRCAMPQESTTAQPVVAPPAAAHAPAH
jgi:hypothetical protein